MRIFVKLGVILLLFASSAISQTTNQGAILGTVTDPSGAVVPNVQVEAVNNETSAVRTATTNGEGIYHIDFLVPGTYRIRALSKGFKNTEITGLVLTVGQPLTVNVKLELGATNQKVTIHSTAAPINTVNATLGDVIPEQAINNLPLNGREWIQLASLVPGAQSGNPKRGVYLNKSTVAVGFNGARANYNGYYVDGSDSTDPWYNQLVSSPSLDAVQEFRVETNMYSAQYGRAAGAIVSAVTKSGTNAFHGDIYEYHRDKALDTRPYFSSTTPKSQLANYLINQFGWTAGGPIKRNKSFFFVANEYFRENKPGSLYVGFAPTAAERNGDYTNTINPWTNQPVQLMDPYTGQAIQSNILPSNLINPVGKKLMGMWPEPNYPSDPFANLHLFLGGTYNQTKWLGRVDHTFNERNIIFGSFDYSKYSNNNEGPTQYGNSVYGERDRTMSVTYTHIFTPSLVNDLKFSHTWYFSGTAQQLEDQNYAKVWGADTTLQSGNGSPAVYLYSQGYRIFYLGGSGDYKHRNRTLYIKDNLAWVRGNHSLLFGGDLRKEDFGWLYESGHGRFYVGLLDGPAAYQNTYGTAGSTFADLLVGLPNLFYGGLGGGKYMPLARTADSLYVQDNWKVHRRLTLNLGLRYGYEAPFSATNNEFLTLDFNTGVPRYAAGAPSDLLSSLRFPYETGGPNRPYEPRKTNFSPRIGFAFRPFDNDRTVVRGGYGMFYTSENAFTTIYGSWTLPFNGLFNYYPKAFYWPDGQDHWQTFDQPPFDATYPLGKNPGFFAPDTLYYPTGYLQQYNFTIDRDLGRKLTFELAWVGSKGTNLNGVGSIQFYDNALSQKLAQNIPGWSPLLRQKGFNSKYNSLQASVRREAGHGLWFLGNYTWSHGIAQSSNDDANEQNLIDTTENGLLVIRRYSNSDFDVRQRFSFSSNWMLPVGRGQHFGSHWNRGLDALAGGWQLNTIVTFQSGFPFTVYDSALHYPDRTCNGNLSSSKRTYDHWFDYSCFVNHPSQTIVDPVTGLSKVVDVQGNSGANLIYGPGMNNWDIGVQKNFRITERFHAQLRGEFFNAFNHPNLDGPSGTYFYNTVSGAKINRSDPNRDHRDIQVALKLFF